MSTVHKQQKSLIAQINKNPLKYVSMNNFFNPFENNAK